MTVDIFHAKENRVPKALIEELDQIELFLV